MTVLRIIALVSFFITGKSFAVWYKSGTFILDCKDQAHPAHLMPLAFYEFQDQVEVHKLPNNLFKGVLSAAPVTFASLPRKFNSFRKLKVPPASLAPDRADPLIQPPAGCVIEIIAQQDYVDEHIVELNQELWGKLPPKIQHYVLIELAMYQLMKEKLAPVDYRRFTLFLISGEFEKYSIEQKIYFLKHHGVEELGYSGVSLDPMREILFYDDGQTIKDAYAFPGATFEGGEIDTRRFISFGRNGNITALATLTPFKRTIKGQEFSFFIPKEEGGRFFDKRYEPRTLFHPNGQVAESYVLPFATFYNLVTKIENTLPYKRKFFLVRFFEDGAPEDLERIKTGVIKHQNIEHRIYSVSWWKNGSMKEFWFDKEKNVMFQGKLEAARGIRCDEKGETTGVIKDIIL